MKPHSVGLSVVHKLCHRPYCFSSRGVKMRPAGRLEHARLACFDVELMTGEERDYGFGGCIRIVQGYDCTV
jgi:hypothetical protein